jgi:hypothetical protein
MQLAVSLPLQSFLMKSSHIGHIRAAAEWKPVFSTV